MSMGHYGYCADVVEKEFVIEQCPKEYQTFIDSFSKTTTKTIDLEIINLESFARDMEVGDLPEEEEIKDIIDAYENLVRAFDTKTGLNLEVGYHDPEYGYPRGDQVYEIYWSVGQVWKKTMAGEKWKDKIQHAHWVAYG